MVFTSFRSRTAHHKFRSGITKNTAAIVSLGLAVTGAASAFKMSSSQAASVGQSGPVVNGYEQATIANTNYVIPSGALFVDPAGSDTAAGTQAAPFATIGKALSVAPASGTVVLRSGTYREGGLFARKAVNLQAFPHEQAWLNGSVVVGGFVQQGATWTKAWTSNLCQTCFPLTAIDPLVPAAGLPDQVFFDGIPQQQVVAANAVVPGTFFYDASNHRLVLGSNPGAATVEVTVFDLGLKVGGSSPSSVRGIGFTHYGAQWNYTAPAAVIGIGNTTFENNTFAWSASRGLAVFGGGEIVTDNLFLYNGDNGFKAHTADGLIFQRNRVAFSNQERFSILPSPTQTEAGAKITHSWNTVFSNNTFEDNFSNGLWFDQSSTNTVIANSRFLRNAGAGIAYEVSGLVTIANNVVADNGRDGIKLSGVSGAEVWNNTVVGNGKAAIGIYEDPRHDSIAADNAAGITHDTANVRMFNNIFVSAANSTKPTTMSFDISVPRVLSASDMIAADDYNVWGRPTAVAPQTMFYWAASPTSMGRYTNLAAAQVATSRELHSTSADNVATSTMFVNPAGYNYTVVLGSAAFRTGAPIPAAVLAVMGSPAGTVTVGAH